MKQQEHQENWPTISIVTPSLNQSQFLDQTIHSVLSQNYPSLEYIIVDGGSTDGSLEVIKNQAKNLAYWCSEEDQGHYHAVQKGFAHSSGEIMAWLNSDDLYCPWALKTVGSIFRRFPEVNWITTLNQFFWNKDGHCTFIKQLAGFSAHAFADGENGYFGATETGFIQQESTFWRRSLWDQVGGLDLSYELAADFDLWSRFFERTTLYGVYSPLAGFRIHDSNRSSDKQAYSKEVHKVLEIFRRTNPHFTKRYRSRIRHLVRKIPGLRKHRLFYSSNNIYRSSQEDGDEWLIRKIKF